MSRTTTTTSTATTDYWYDATGMTLESSTTGGANATYLRSPKGKLLSVNSSAGFMNYATDRLGSVTATTNTGGNLSNTYRYDPWGSHNGITGSTYNPYMYTGTYNDHMLGYYQMGARYY